MDLSNNFAWNELFNLAQSDEDKGNLEILQNILTIDEVRFLYNKISTLKNPKSIKILEEYQKRQHELGAWVEGIFPDQFTDDEITVPNSFSNKIKCMLELAEQKKKNIDAIKAMGEYNLEFKNDNDELNFGKKNYPENWILEIDLEVLSQSLDFIESKELNKKQAREIANLKGNQEMLKHRKNLGYLPEPITTSEDLTELLIWGASGKTVDIIWKWLNPFNIFEFADIYNNLDKFNELHNTVDENREKIISHILSKISNYIKNDLKFSESFSLTVGFAIRGWATDDRFGVNIENIKDDYDRLIATIAHELFHRLQTKICTSKDQEQSFSGITSGNFSNEKDNKFYEILSYIMLEGTGEYITHQFVENKENNLEKKAIEGMDLLNKSYEIIYSEEDLDKADELLAKGLKSNGIFYSLGEYLSKSLVEKKGENYLGEILEKGVGSFFIEGLKGEEKLDFNVGSERLSKLISSKHI